MNRSVQECLMFVMLSLSLFLPTEGRGDVAAYRWVDDSGTMHFGDVPPVSAVRGPVEMLRLKKAPFVPPDEDAKGRPLQWLPERKPPASTTRKVEKASVELYTASWCVYCRRAKAFLQDRGIEFTEYDVDRDHEAARRRRTLAPGGGIPLAVINGTVVVGFSQARYERALGNTGDRQ